MGYALINGYSIDNNLKDDIHYSFVNYRTTTQANLSNLSILEALRGDKIPSFLKIYGKVTPKPFMDKEFEMIAIFFDNFSPFYFNKFSNEIACSGNHDNTSGQII